MGKLLPMSDEGISCRYASIDVASDKIARSLRKMKEKAVKKGQWPGRGHAKGVAGIKDAAPEDVLSRLSMDEPTDDEVETATARLGSLPDSVKRTKVFYLDAMSVQVTSLVPGHVAHDAHSRCWCCMRWRHGTMLWVRQSTLWNACRTPSTSWTWWTMTSSCISTRTRAMFRLCTSDTLAATE